jgi:hypothetical protein
MRHCPRPGLTKIPLIPRPSWYGGCVASQSRPRRIMPANHSTPTRVAPMLPIRSGKGPSGLRCRVAQTTDGVGWASAGTCRPARPSGCMAMLARDG